MSSAGLDERYLDWLHGQVVSVKQRRKTPTYRSLLAQLHETIFVAIVPHDENRIMDARDLREEFWYDTEEGRVPLAWTGGPCSMFELLVVLSRQLSFEMGDPEDIWFWHLTNVLDLEQFNDNNYNQYAQEMISETLDRVIWRTYDSNGHGGLFPLRRTTRDQRKIELWYQLNAYLLELF